MVYRQVVYRQRERLKEGEREDLDVLVIVHSPPVVACHCRAQSCRLQ